MSFIAAAAIGGLGAIGGGLLAASGARSAASTAADANARSTAATNALNQQLFNESRGSTGHAILPIYFGNNEADLGQQAYQQFQSLAGQGSNYAQQLSGYQSQLSPSLDASFGAIANRYNGADLAQRQGYAQPFFDARTAQAGTYGQGLRDISGANLAALHAGYLQSIGQMNAQRQSQGFLGGSTFDRNRLASSLIGARQQAAIMQAQARAGGNNALSDAALANAGDLRSMNIADLDFRSRPDVLGAALGVGGQFLNAPAQYQSNAFAQAMSPLNYFRISPQAFQNQNMPTQDPQLNSSQIFGSAIGQIGQTGMNYYLNQQLMNSLGRGGIGGPTTYDQFLNANPGSSAATGYQPIYT